MVPALSIPWPKCIRNQIIDRRGRLNRDAPHVRKNDRGFELLLVSGERSGTGRDIVMTQKDVNEIQLAKGAIATGLETLLEATHTPPEEIKEVVIAGAFGTYLNLDSALAIGLLPRLPNAKYVQVGNAAGVGAKMALLITQGTRSGPNGSRSVQATSN